MKIPTHRITLPLLPDSIQSRAKPTSINAAPNPLTEAQSLYQVSSNSLLLRPPVPTWHGLPLLQQGLKSTGTTAGVFLGTRVGEQLLYRRCPYRSASQGSQQGVPGGAPEATGNAAEPKPLRTISEEMFSYPSHPRPSTFQLRPWPPAGGSSLLDMIGYRRESSWRKTCIFPEGLRETKLEGSGGSTW